MNKSDFIVKDGEPIPIYPCDPDKNEVCRSKHEKNWCGVECKSTFHKEYAKDVEEWKL